MVEVSRWLSIVAPLVLWVTCGAALRYRWGHTLVRPALWLTFGVAAAVTVYRVWVALWVDASTVSGALLSFVVFANNFVIALLSVVVLVYVGATRQWRKQHLPYVVSKPSREVVLRWRRSG